MVTTTNSIDTNTATQRTARRSGPIAACFSPRNASFRSHAKKKDGVKTQSRHLTRTRGRCCSSSMHWLEVLPKPEQSGCINIVNPRLTTNDRDELEKLP